MNVVFADIDGVLNTHSFNMLAGSNTIDRDKMTWLNIICVQSRAKIVLTSAWRYHIHRNEMNLSGLSWMLRTHGLHSDLLIGVTRADTMIDRKPVENERGKQIQDYLDTFVGLHGVPITKYVVIDDLDLGITAAGHPFVKVEPGGLTYWDAIQTIKLLDGEYP